MCGNKEQREHHDEGHFVSQETVQNIHRDTNLPGLREC